jgi:uncharacterized protein YerC
MKGFAFCHSISNAFEHSSAAGFRDTGLSSHWLLLCFCRSRLYHSSCYHKTLCYASATTIYRSACMPHISRHVPEKKIADEIYSVLLTHITRKGAARDRARLFEELFTHVEHVMLAKRFAIICMLGEGYSFGDIQETLRVSPSTVGRLWAAMQRGKYRETVRIVKKQKLSSALLKVLDSLTFVPRSVHAPRWKWLDDLE